MNNASAKLPPIRGAMSGMARGFDDILRATSLEAIELIIQQTGERTDANFQVLAGTVNRVVGDMISVMSLHRDKVDVDQLVESLQRDERGSLEIFGAITKSAEKALRLAAKKHPAMIPGLNRLLTQAREVSHREAAMYRDARWRLMEARARYQPGVPAGPIKGKATDLDAYLRTLA